MNILLGASIGLLGGIGLLIAIAHTPPLRRLTLAQRIAPYITDSDTAHQLRRRYDPSSTVLRRLADPLLRDLARLVDRIFGGQESVRRRLSALQVEMTLEQFRIQQVLTGAAGLAGGVGLSGVFLLLGYGNPALLLGLTIFCAIAGLLTRDWLLTQAVDKRHNDILAEFPVIAEMLALAVTAGQGPLDAITRVAQLSRGYLADQLIAIANHVKSGTSLQQALRHARDTCQQESLSRFFDGIAIAIERGTPMAGVLRAQAADVRALGKRQLLEAGGKKEILMMIPVVFCVLPITIIFAFFPGLIAIITVAQ